MKCSNRDCKNWDREALVPCAECTKVELEELFAPLPPITPEKVERIMAWNRHKAHPKNKEDDQGRKEVTS